MTLQCTATCYIVQRKKLPSTVNKTEIKTYLQRKTAGALIAMRFAVNRLRLQICDMILKLLNGN